MKIIGIVAKLGRLVVILFLGLRSFKDMFFILRLIVILYLLGVALIIYSKRHFFIILIALEFMILIVLSMLLSLYNQGLFEFRLYYVFLVVVVCEASMGLAVLISLSRFWGNEVVKI
jgi:hypothetical protein